MAHIDVLADDRGLATCLRGAQIKEEWATPYLTHHQIGTLDDFVYTVTGHEWEKSLGISCFRCHWAAAQQDCFGEIQKRI